MQNMMTKSENSALLMNPRKLSSVLIVLFVWTIRIHRNNVHSENGKKLQLFNQKSLLFTKLIPQESVAGMMRTVLRMAPISPIKYHVLYACHKTTDDHGKQLNHPCCTPRYIIVTM